MIKSYVIRGNQTLILDSLNNLYIFHWEQLVRTEAVSSQYQIKIQDQEVYVLDYQSMDLQYYDFDQRKFVSPDLRIKSVNFYDIYMIHGCFYVQYKLFE